MRSSCTAPATTRAASPVRLATSSAQFVAKLRKLANEFSDLHNDDKHLPIGVRRPASVVLALRSWELDDFNKLRRKRRTRAAA